MRMLHWSKLIEEYGQPVGAGAESTYWDMKNGQGIKVMRTPFRLPNGEGNVFHACPTSLANSMKWKETQRQFELMQFLSKKKRCPKPIELLTVVDDRAVNAIGYYLYCPAIIMEHIKFTQGNYNSKTRYKAYNKFLDRFRKDMVLTDVHQGNVVFSDDKKRFMVIDLGDVKKVGEP